MMASSRECYPLNADSRSKKTWRDKHVCVVGMTNHGYRVFSLIEVVSGERSAKFLMDAITGTFYEADTGFCCTSLNERIRHIAFVDDIRPYLKAGASYSHLHAQFGQTRYGRDYK